MFSRYTAEKFSRLIIAITKLCVLLLLYGLAITKETKFSAEMKFFRFQFHFIILELPSWSERVFVWISS